MRGIVLLYLWTYGFSLSALGALQYQRVRPNGMAILACGELKEGNVTWSKDMNGSQVSILTTNNKEIIRHMKNNRYSALSNLSLIIWFVSVLDEGLYYCNGMPVACLAVKPADGQNTEDLSKCATGADVMARVLAFGGVGLAALMFLIATAAAVKAFCSTIAHTKDHTHTIQTDQDYINLREQEFRS